MTLPAPTATPRFKTRVFLWGADMNPSRIRGRWPDGRFIAIAWATGALTRSLGLAPQAFGPEVWGVVVETGVAQRGTPVPLTLRDGASATAMLVADPADLGGLPDILAEAHYWELPQGYRDRIQAVIDAPA